MAQEPVNPHSPADHQHKGEEGSDDRNAAAQHQAGIKVEAQSERHPCKTERLDQPQHQFATIVHDYEVVQIEQVKTGETEGRGQGRLQEPVLNRQFEPCVLRADTQGHSADDGEVDPRRITEHEYHRPSTWTQHTQFQTAPPALRRAWANSLVFEPLTAFSRLLYRYW